MIKCKGCGREIPEGAEVARAAKQLDVTSLVDEGRVFIDGEVFAFHPGHVPGDYRIVDD